jgi:hypothetical protein
MRSPKFRKDSNILEVLDNARDFLATDPRDKVYALLSMHSFAEQCRPLDADYTKPAIQVFRDLTENIVKNSESLNILSHVQHDKKIETPSWIPRWDKKTPTDVINTFDSEWGTRYNDYMPPSFNKEYCSIAVIGIKFDSVVEVKKIDTERLVPLDFPHAGDDRLTFWRDEFSIDHTSPSDSIRSHSMVFTVGKDSSLKRVNEKIRGASLQHFLSLVSKANPPSSSLKSYPQDVHEFVVTVNHINKGWSFFKTIQGHIGLGLDCLWIGDIVCILFGAGVPFILRPEDDHYLLVGECYVHGIMDGEAIKKWREGKLGAVKAESFEIR